MDAAAVHPISALLRIKDCSVIFNTNQSQNDPMPRHDPADRSLFLPPLLRQPVPHFFTSAGTELVPGRAVESGIFSVAKPPAQAGRNPRAVDLLPPPSLIPSGALRNSLLLTRGRHVRPLAV